MWVSRGCRFGISLKGRRLRGARLTARFEGNEAVASARRKLRIR